MYRVGIFSEDKRFVRRFVNTGKMVKSFKGGQKENMIFSRTKFSYYERNKVEYRRHHSCNESQQDALFLNFILVKNSTRFGEITFHLQES